MSKTTEELSVRIGDFVFSVYEDGQGYLYISPDAGLDVDEDGWAEWNFKLTRADDRAKVRSLGETLVRLANSFGRLTGRPE